ncbi:SLBB domain-containing protein [Verrucomicrobium sp. GAS474]|nr:SLBB domain-containing protein [Verrucomicrobium sp. GAS474]
MPSNRPSLPSGRLNFGALRDPSSPLSLIPIPTVGGDGTLTRIPLPKDAEAKAQLDALDDKTSLGAGDQFTYQVIEDRDPPKRLTVNELGEVDVPYLGRVNIYGKTPRQLALSLKASLEKELYFRATPLILIDDIAQSRGAFYIYGQIRNPGQQSIAPKTGTRISRAILNAGGLTDTADKTRVTILRKEIDDQEKTITLDITDILDQPNGPSDILLRPQDVVTIPVLADAKRARILVLGRVNSPGEQILPPANADPLNVSRAILQAGGFAPFADRHKVRILRQKEGSVDREEIFVDVLEILEKGRDDLDIPLQANDRVIVTQKVFNF